MNKKNSDFDLTRIIEIDQSGGTPAPSLSRAPPPGCPPRGAHPSTAPPPQPFFPAISLPLAPPTVFSPAPPPQPHRHHPCAFSVTAPASSNPSTVPQPQPCSPCSLSPLLPSPHSLSLSPVTKLERERMAKYTARYHNQGISPSFFMQKINQDLDTTRFINIRWNSPLRK
ncbi:hypothetical protein Fmac_008196 [Flemingia macrophylla]|uniref:Uncharacterized protein n=1 Tax=Flemingia macrophylla TaxID=520843 RepID=A0ABD1MWQ6_9FABA